MRRIAFTILLSALVSACASTGEEYPSLAIRDGERMSGSSEAVEPEAPVERMALSTQTATRVAQLRELGAAAHAKFDELEARTARLVSAARGSVITTKSNASAQIALAELQSAHDATLAVLAELDVLLAEATLTGARLDPISEARDTLIATAEAERARLVELSRALPSR